MSETYRAVIRRTGDKNELVHWKYLKKVKKNGKWRYYYDTDSLKKDVSKALGIDAKEQMEQKMDELLAAKERLQFLQAASNNGERTSSKYEQEIADITKQIASMESEISFDKGVLNAYKEQLQDRYSDNYLKIPKKDIEDYNSMAAKIKESESKVDNYTTNIAQINDLNRSVEDNMRRTERAIEYTERKIKELEDSYKSQKNIYDNSFIGYIDRGKRFFEKCKEYLEKKTTTGAIVGGLGLTLSNEAYRNRR